MYVLKLDTPGKIIFFALISSSYFLVLHKLKFKNLNTFSIASMFPSPNLRYVSSKISSFYI